MDWRVISAVVFTVGIFLDLPLLILTMRYYCGLERHEHQHISDHEVPMMWLKWAVILVISGLIVFALPYLVPYYIGVYILGALGAIALCYLFVSHIMSDPPQTRRSQLTPEERNRLVLSRIEELRRQHAQGPEQEARARGSAPRKPFFKGVPPEVIATFPFKIWVSDTIVTAPSAFSPASEAENLPGPSTKLAQHRPDQLQVEEGTLPGLIVSPSATTRSVPAEADPSFASNLASPAFKQQLASSRILSIINGPVKSRLFSISISKTKVAPAEEGPTCPICLEEFQDGEQVSTMPCHGQHEFHTQCISDWMKAHRNCPICRGDLWDGVSRAAANAVTSEMQSARNESNQETEPVRAREPARLNGQGEEGGAIRTS